GLMGYFFNNFLPSSVGGDILKAAGIARVQSRRTVAVATVLIDRIIGLCGLFWLVTLLGGFFWFSGILETLGVTDQATVCLTTIVQGAALLSGLTLGFWLLLGVLPSRRVEIFAGRLLKIPKIGHSLAEAWRAVWMYRCRNRSVALALGLSVVGHI